MAVKLTYTKGNLFSNLTEDVVYLHACNSQNVWGAGVSVLFKKHFYKAYLDYKRKNNKCGDGYVVSHMGFRIACLITSERYGKLKDPPKKILVQTYIAVQKLLESLPDKEVTIYSPKINSGYFATPWVATEKVIIRACEKIDKKINWIVWEL